jgi:acetylglutamate kinase
VLFTPHLVPMNRGILATCYARPTDAGRRPTTRRLGVYRERYADEPFVVVDDASPSTKATLGPTASTSPHGPIRAPAWIMAIAALDNLTKGASGGAVQAANVALGLDETAGLPDRGGHAVIEVATQKVATLVEALPYIRRFAGKVVVVKYGGNALAGTSGPRRARTVRRGHRADAPRRHPTRRGPRWRPADQPADGTPRQDDRVPQRAPGDRRRDGRHRPDGPDRPGQPPDRRGDQRPRELRRRRQRRGRRADQGHRARAPELGFVGDVTAIDPSILHGLIRDEFVPVVATVGTDDAGQPYNINADTVAGAIAESLGAEKLVYLTDIEGLRRDVGDAASLIRQTTADELESPRCADGVIAGGMIPKVTSCISAVRNGVATVPTSSTGASPTCCCSRCSPIQGSAR